MGNDRHQYRGKNATDINFAIINNQVKFIDTVKYFQQSLASLAESMTDQERDKVRKMYRRFLAEKLALVSDKSEEWVLDYMSSGKGVIPYQMITNFDSLNFGPEHGEFFKPENFHSSLKECEIGEEEYENVKKNFEAENSGRSQQNFQLSGHAYSL